MTTTTNPARTLAEESLIHALRFHADGPTPARPILLRAAAELDRLRGEVERKDAALRMAIPDLKENIDACGSCDHSVNICVCGAISVLEQCQAALEPKPERA